MESNPHHITGHDHGKFSQISLHAYRQSNGSNVVQVRDSATSVPSEYEPPMVFNLSLQHTDPKLTWDADDEGRKRVLHKK
jgi:predicted glycoside hydrolase/deacetylase ChbG (UPF0249 family)